MPKLLTGNYSLIDDKTGKAISLEGPGLDSKGRSELFIYKGAVTAKSTGLPDKRVNQMTPYGGPGCPNGVDRIIAKQFLAFQLIQLTEDFYKGMVSAIESMEIADSQKAVNLTFTLISDALKNGMIPPSYQNLHDVSIISSIILDGSGNEGFLNLNPDGTSAGINQRSVDFQRIANDIIVKDAEKIKESGFTPSQLNKK